MRIGRKRRVSDGSALQNARSGPWVALTSAAQLTRKLLDALDLDGRGRPARTTLSMILTFLATSLPLAQTRTLAPFVPTPQDVVERMLTLAKVGASDVVYDLGRGAGPTAVLARE